jgi:hypothetical protein
MKNYLIGAVLAAATMSSFAQYGHYRPPIHHHGHSNDWVAPLIIGGIIGAVITRENNPVVVQQPHVIIQQPLPSNTVIIDGRLYVKQIMSVDGIYREVLVRQ